MVGQLICRWFDWLQEPGGGQDGDGMDDNSGGGQGDGGSGGGSGDKGKDSKTEGKVRFGQ